MSALQGKTVVITGASRGIGREIALKCAKEGANVVVAAKSKDAHPKLPGTIVSVAKEIEGLGAKAMWFQLDVRFPEQIEALVAATKEKFGGADILINNAGAIKLTPTSMTPVKSYDLMMNVNVRATFLCSQAFLPLLEKSDHAHILNLSPPINLADEWLQNHVAYTISKYGMSMCTLGMAAEFKEKEIAVNSLWPKTAIATAAIEWLMGKEAFNHCRTPDIMADAALAVLSQHPTEVTGQHLIDEDVLKSRGVTDFDKYAVKKGEELYPDFFVSQN